MFFLSLLLSLPVSGIFFLSVANLEVTEVFEGVILVEVFWLFGFGFVFLVSLCIWRDFFLQNFFIFKQQVLEEINNLENQSILLRDRIKPIQSQS